jgi:hypothetical protein
MGPLYFTLSEARTTWLAQASLVKAYHDRPRIVVISATLNFGDQPGPLPEGIGIDLVRDSVRGLAFPGQSATAAMGFQAIRGVSESHAERDAIAAVSGPTPIVGVPDVILAAQAQGIPLVLLKPSDLGELDALDILADPKARIAMTLAAGNLVVVPVGPVTIQGTKTTAWYEIRPATGEVIGVTADGLHGRPSVGANGGRSNIEYAAVMAFVALSVALGAAFLGPRISEGISQFMGSFQNTANQLDEFNKSINPKNPAEHSLAPFLQHIQSEGDRRVGVGKRRLPGYRRQRKAKCITEQIGKTLPEIGQTSTNLPPTFPSLPE